MAKQLALLLTLAALAIVVDARPAVRELKTDAEFKRLLKHHKQVSHRTHCLCTRRTPPARSLLSLAPALRGGASHRATKPRVCRENTGLPVIIDYFSDGCGPCRQIAPHYTRLAKEYKASCGAPLAR